ncbi:MAG: hypothetical protein PUK49_03910 [Oscillospiraceae bacterium]|nr:hypothetical protein [Oscillospiraceae bacterium]
MLYLIISWLLSPPVLIIVTIVQCRKKEKLQRFVSELLRKDRIDYTEYSELRVRHEDTAAAPQSSVTEAPVFSDGNINGNVCGEPARQPYAYRQNNYSASASALPSPAYQEETAVPSEKQSAPEKQRRSKGSAGAMSVLMTIGIIFVILAGLVFSTAVWVNLGNFGRTCAVGGVAALFFGISAFAGRKLKLDSTAFAFYTLGSFFSAITLITAGFFRLLGSYLSVDGGGRFILFSLAALIVSILSANGLRIFGKPAAAYISAFGGTIAAILLLIHFSDETGMFALLAALLTLAVNTVIYSIGAKLPDKWDKPVRAASGTLYAVGLLCGIAAAFSDSAEFCACAGVYVLRCAAVSVMAFKGHPVYKKRLPAAVSLLSGIFFSAALIWKLSGSLDIFALALTIFALVFIGVFFTYDIDIPDEWKGTIKLSAVLLSVSGLISSFAALGRSFGEWNGVCFAVAGLYIVSSLTVGILAYRGHEAYGKVPSAFAALFTGMTFSVMLIAELSHSTAVSALCLTLLFLLFINAVYSVPERLPEGWKAASAIAAAVLGAISTAYSVYVLCGSFDSWDAACYATAALYILQSIAVAVMAFMGHSGYSKSRWGAYAHITGLLFAAFMLIELSPHERCFMILLAVLAVSYTIAADVFLREKTPEGWLSVSKAAKVILNIAAVLTSAGVLIDCNQYWDIFCIITAVLYIAYTAFLGIYFKKAPLKGAECIISCFTLYNMYCLIVNRFENAPVLILVCLLFAAALIHHFAKPVRTAFSDIFLTAAVIISALYSSGDEHIFALMGFAVPGILLLIEAAERERSLSALFGALLPLPVIGMISTAMTMTVIYFPFGLTAAVNAAVLAAIAAAVLILTKRSGAVFYSFAVTASVLVLLGTDNGSFGIQLLFIAVSVLLTALFGISANNLPSLLSMAGTALAVRELADTNDSVTVHIITAAIFAAVCLTASRIFFPKKLIVREKGLLRIDTCCTGILLAIPMLSGISGNAEIFAVLTLIAVFTANLARREQNGGFNRAALTAGCGFFTAALINRPFLTVSDELFSGKITLGLICIFGFVFSKLWKKYPKLSENVSAAIYSLSFICLIIEALTREDLFNTLIVLGVSLIILLYSFIRRKKRWFAVSSIALTGLTLYIFRDFFRMIDWWVYLLAVGLLLIAVASANEYFIKKGRELKEKAGRFFEDWTW